MFRLDLGGVRGLQEQRKQMERIQPMQCGGLGCRSWRSQKMRLEDGGIRLLRVFCTVLRGLALTREVKENITSFKTGE